MWRITENAYFQKFISCCDLGNCGGRVFLKGRDSIIEMFPLFSIDSKRLLKLFLTVDPELKNIRRNQNGDYYTTMISFSNMKKQLFAVANSIENENERLRAFNELISYEHFVFETKQRVEMFKTCVKHAANLLLEENGFRDVHFDTKLELVE